MATCGLLVPGALKSSQLITLAGCSARYLRLSHVVVFVVFASCSPCMMMMVGVYGVMWAAAKPVSLIEGKVSRCFDDMVAIVFYGSGP